MYIIDTAMVATCTHLGQTQKGYPSPTRTENDRTIASSDALLRISFSQKQTKYLSYLTSARHNGGSRGRKTRCVRRNGRRLPRINHTNKLQNRVSSPSQWHRQMTIFVGKNIVVLQNANNCSSLKGKGEENFGKKTVYLTKILFQIMKHQLFLELKNGFLYAKRAF